MHLSIFWLTTSKRCISYITGLSSLRNMNITTHSFIPALVTADLYQSFTSNICVYAWMFQKPDSVFTCPYIWNSECSRAKLTDGIEI
jgi:hypothetical protein